MFDGLLNLLIKLINFVILAIGNFISFVVGLLPDSPFQVLDSMNFEFLDSLNWVIPISFMLTFLSYWIVGIGLYYLISIPLRWVKVIS